jgi:hypothetical protein
MHLIKLTDVFLGCLFELIYKLLHFRLVLIYLFLHDSLARGGLLHVTLQLLDQLPLFLEVTLQLLTLTAVLGGEEVSLLFESL